MRPVRFSLPLPNCTCRQGCEVSQEEAVVLVEEVQLKAEVEGEGVENKEAGLPVDPEKSKGAGEEGGG